MIKRIVNFARKKVAQLSYVKNVNFRPEYPIVTFTFDDVPASGFEKGVEILSKYGFQGTFYTAFSFLDGEGTTYFKEDHVQKAMEKGNEIACHTFNHLDFYDVTQESIITEDLARNQAEMEKVAEGCRMDNFSYPFGHQLSTSRKIVREMYSSARGNEFGINNGIVDLNNLRSVRLYEKKYRRDRVYSFIDKTIREKGWLILYTHDIKEDYSKHGCSTSYFEDVVNYCGEKKVNVMTVRQVMEMIDVPAPASTNSMVDLS